jgi:hypothetical protein
MKINIAKELEDNKVVLLLVPSIEYNDDTKEIAKVLSKKNLGYITLNKTFGSLKEDFLKAKANVDNILFIDAISKTIKSVPDQAKGVYYLSAPNSLTEISLNVSRLINHKFDYIVFDSLTNLLIYQGKAPVAKFLSTIINKIRDSPTRAVFYCLDTKEHEELIEEASMFVDKVIKL